MDELVFKQKEMLNKLNKDLLEIKGFLLGNDKEDTCCNALEESCFMDTIKKNLSELDYALFLTETIKATIMGGKK